jgi:hypothetical protein
VQKLTLSIDDDIYVLLHKHIGRGNIGRFVSNAIRPHLMNAAHNQPNTAFGMLSHLATKTVSEKAGKEAKRLYMEKRYAAKQARI